MRITSCTFLLALALIPIATAQTVRSPARKPAAAAKPAVAVVPTPSAAMPCTCPVPVRSIQPYTAKQETTRVQTLNNGTTIKTVEDVYLARDPQGRTRRQTIRTQNSEATHFFEIYDATTQTRYTWTVGAGYPQVVTVFHARPNPQTQPVTPQPPRYYPYRTESLPPQTIAGIYVEGTRTTRTTPAGYVGNDRDFVSTTENWYSPTLGLQLRYVSDDPRSGKSTTEVTDLHQTAPDPALFQPPAGYILKDAN